VVSGKGGTGKTTVATALAVALAEGGRRVLLLEVEGRQGIAQLFGLESIPYEQTHVAVAPHGGDVYALSVDPEAAMLEYLRMFYNIKRGGTALKKVGAIDFATTIAPGLRDVLVTGKAGESVRRRNRSGDLEWDAVVMDAPPTGRITRFLNVNDEVKDLARMGPIKNQAESVMRVIKSPETAIHLVSILEEMPVQETLDGIAELEVQGLPIGAVFVNMLQEETLPEQFITDGTGLGAEQVSAGLEAAGLAATPGLVASLQQEASDHRSRVLLQRAERERLDAAPVPLIDLPYLPSGVDLRGIAHLARTIREQAPRGRR